MMCRLGFLVVEKLISVHGQLSSISIVGWPIHSVTPSQIDLISPLMIIPICF